VNIKQEDDAPSTQKVRRRVFGGKPAMGHKLQQKGQRIRRRSPKTIHLGQTDSSLTAVGGLLEFEQFLELLGVARDLRRNFARLKTGPLVVYPMATQLAMLIDLFVVGESRVFALEALAADPLFLMLSGGFISSIDTVYDDLARFDENAVQKLESMMAHHGLGSLEGRKWKELDFDLDTTVTPVFGVQQGALPGYNPRYHGRPSYHPILLRCAQTDSIVGAELRPGDYGLGDDDVPMVLGWVQRVRSRTGPACLIRIRVDSGGDCACLFSGLDNLGVQFVIKARLTPDLFGAISCHKRWRTVDWDAYGRPLTQVATISFHRKEWEKHKLGLRIVAVRTRDRLNGKEVFAWEQSDFSVQAYITNDWCRVEEDIADLYHPRAGIEPLIGELKGAWTVGKIPTSSFDANHAAFLIKLLSYNLFRRFVGSRYRKLAQLRWRTAWVRRLLILRPGRFVRKGGNRTELRLAPRPQLE
jgi:hypothetical protein